MTISPETDKAARLSAVAALIEQRVEHSERSACWRSRRATSTASIRKTSRRATSRPVRRLLSHWQFAQRREPGKAKIRVISPVAGEHGWSSATGVRSSTTTCLSWSTRLDGGQPAGPTLHLIVHPIFAVSGRGRR